MTIARTILRRLIQRFPRRWLCFHGGVAGTIALTFDDGPDGHYSQLILDVLDQFNVPATFFLVGANVVRHQKLVRRMVSSGHGIGMHSFTHCHYAAMPTKEKITEINRSFDAIAPFAGDTCRMFRPPQGILSLQVLWYCIQHKMITVMWSRDSHDSRGVDPLSIVRRSCEGISGEGDILLFHDDNMNTLEALPEIIRHFQGLKYRFLTVKDMVA